MLAILIKGGNFVLKIYLPTTNPVFVSIYYLLYCRFRQFMFYKSFQNKWSPEYYIIGKYYYDPLSDNELEKLYTLLKDFDRNNTIIPIDKIPEDFLIQLEDVLSQIIMNFRNAIKRVIYYLDNIDEMSHEQMTTLYKSFDYKNEDWASMYKIRKIQSKDNI